jgi:5,10-methylenetetrahydromethanopterin reductase
MSIELWTLTALTLDGAAARAAKLEEAGWDGVAVVDSQNLAGDVYLVLAGAASGSAHLGLATGVTNPLTRHPAVTASAIAGIQSLSGGRATLGIGRGDSALAHVGRAPAGVGPFERYLSAVQTYLRGEGVAFADVAEHATIAAPVDSLGLADSPTTSALHWLPRSLPKVPVEVAATGPRVIEAAARHAERVMFGLTADLDRLRWGMDVARAAAGSRDLAFGAYVNVVCHPDPEIGRDLVRGGLSTFARFSVMHGTVSGPATEEQRAVLGAVHDRYDMTSHTQTGSDQADALTPAFIDRAAIVGPPEVCIARLQELAAAGIDKVAVIGPSLGADPAEARVASRLFAAEVLPTVGARGR